MIVIRADRTDGASDRSRSSDDDVGIGASLVSVLVLPLAQMVSDIPGHDKVMVRNG